MLKKKIVHKKTNKVTYRKGSDSRQITHFICLHKQPFVNCLVASGGRMTPFLQ